MFCDLAPAIIAKAAGVKFEALAREVGVAQATIARVQGGGVPDLHTFALLCVWLDRSPADFLTGVPHTHTGRRPGR